MHGKVKITKVKVLKPYQIEVGFHNNTLKAIDLEPILYGSVYGVLRNPALFEKVRVNPEVATVEWPNGADFDPETLYYWEDYKEELAERAKSWVPINQE